MARCCYRSWSPACAGMTEISRLLLPLAQVLAQLGGEPLGFLLVCHSLALTQREADGHRRASFETVLP